MKTESRKAFTMIELVMVIVVIGILSAIAIPKFAESTKMAHLSKAKSVLSSVMSAMATERQKRILRGKADENIEDLGDATYAFYKFQNGTQSEILVFPEKNCATGQTACWSRASATSYIYKFADSAEADAKFKLENNRLVCDGTAAACAKILD